MREYDRGQRPYRRESLDAPERRSSDRAVNHSTHKDDHEDEHLSETGDDFLDLFLERNVFLLLHRSSPLDICSSFQSQCNCSKKITIDPEGAHTYIEQMTEDSQTDVKWDTTKIDRENNDQF